MAAGRFGNIGSGGVLVSVRIEHVGRGVTRHEVGDHEFSAQFIGDLQYIPHGHARNRLDLYLPQRVMGSLPVVVWIHGGGWRGGGKEGGPALSLLARRYAVASINYRLSQDAVFPAQLEDCKAAIWWLRTNAAKFRIDPARMGVWGESAGGHLAALLGTTGGIEEWNGDDANRSWQRSCVQCVVDWYGPVDLARWNSRGDINAMITQLIGGDPHGNMEKARKASPVTHVNKNAAPFLIMHGDQDDSVPLSQSAMLAKALKEAGVEFSLQIIKGGGHGGPEFTSQRNIRLVEAFFAKHLGKNRPQEVPNEKKSGFIRC